ncbi:MAG: hypothetical protein IPJ69_12755 [Deltaproteobacteria bacterium]|nr:MAG: hypothetical protein IPJ69_12755 [Deltaproteobacteria bacterium]
MLKNISLTLASLSLGALLTSSISYAENKTTTVEETSSQTTTTPVKKSIPATTTTTYNTTETTTKESEVRVVLDQEALKKMSGTLCTDGFKAYVGNDNKNICQGKATTPDLAYSCVWDKKGEAAYASTPKGPCNLDFTEHRGSIIITKTDYKSNPPLAYGTEAQCCFRAAKDPSQKTSQ